MNPDLDKSDVQQILLRQTILVCTGIICAVMFTLFFAYMAGQPAAKPIWLFGTFMNISIAIFLALRARKLSMLAVKVTQNVGSE